MRPAGSNHPDHRGRLRPRAGSARPGPRPCRRSGQEDGPATAFEALRTRHRRRCRSARSRRRRQPDQRPGHQPGLARRPLCGPYREGHGSADCRGPQRAGDGVRGGRSRSSHRCGPAAVRVRPHWRRRGCRHRRTTVPAGLLRGDGAGPPAGCREGSTVHLRGHRLSGDRRIRALPSGPARPDRANRGATIARFARGRRRGRTARPSGPGGLHRSPGHRSG